MLSLVFSDLAVPATLLKGAKRRCGGGLAVVVVDWGWTENGPVWAAIGLLVRRRFRDSDSPFFEPPGVLTHQRLRLAPDNVAGRNSRNFSFRRCFSGTESAAVQ